jgi:hypothetical protein
MSTDELLATALHVTRVDRARVAKELLSSLEERLSWNGAHEGSLKAVQSTSWPTARTEILKGLEQRRASRTAS